MRRGSRRGISLWFPALPLQANLDEEQLGQPWQRQCQGRGFEPLTHRQNQAVAVPPEAAQWSVRDSCVPAAYKPSRRPREFAGRIVRRQMIGHVQPSGPGRIDLDLDFTQRQICRVDIKSRGIKMAADPVQILVVFLVFWISDRF
jgi:hypothetical protein